MGELHTFSYGTQTLEYRLELQSRKTLEISVHPDMTVTVKAPLDTDTSVIEEKVANRANWILKRRKQYELYLPDIPPRQYVSGESNRYLGRQYRLKVVIPPKAETERVELKPQFIWVFARDKSPEHVKPLVESWYKLQAQVVFSERLAVCFSKFTRVSIPYPKFIIRPLTTSWGSCSTRGLLSFNIKLIQVPKEYIDYVIIHELCHLKAHNHGPQFLRLLSRVMPDWKEKKEKLDHYDFG